MSITVPASFKPSGGIVTQRAAEPALTALTAPTATEDLYDVWQSMTVGETASMPVAQLLRLLGVTVSEVDPSDLPIGVAAQFCGRIGDAEIQLSRSLPQAEREPVVREFLTTINTEPQTRTTGPRAARLVPAVVAAGCVHIECHGWCIVDHVEDPAVNLEDVSHSGDIATLEAPSIDGLPVALLHARLNADPFSSDERLRVPSVQLDEESETRYMAPEQALKFADDLVEFAAAIRAQVKRIA